MRSRLKRIGIAAILAFLETMRGPCLAASEPQDDLKSAIVLSFLRYSEWPAGRPDASPLTVGVLGRPSFFQALRRVLEGKSVNNRPIRTVELTAVTDRLCCDIIYLATEKPPEIRQAVLASLPAHVLTIGETEQFLEAGGAICLVMLDGHMSFKVNLEAVNRSGVVISSKLLRYGEITRRPRG